MSADTRLEQIVASIDNGVIALQKAQDRITELETALNRMVCAHENLSADTEGQYPPLDAGCVECTAGVTPDRYNTGLCAYHNAKRLLGQL